MDDVEQTSNQNLTGYVSSRPAACTLALFPVPSMSPSSTWAGAAVSTDTAVRTGDAVRGRLAGIAVRTHNANGTVVALAKQGAPPRGEPR